MRKFAFALTLAYPFALFGFRDSPYFYEIALGLGGLLILELLTRLSWKRQLLCFAGLGALYGLMRSFGLKNEVRFYPFLMSFSMLLIFSMSKDPLKNPMLGPFRQRFAARPELLLAMHEAKIIWVVGLALNTAILFAFLFAFSQEAWVIYASFYSYILLAGLLLTSIVFVHIRKGRSA